MLSSRVGGSLVAAAVALAPVGMAGARAQQFIPNITISSAVPANGDLKGVGSCRPISPREG
jgi:hypothetical protein